MSSHQDNKQIMDNMKKKNLIIHFIIKKIRLGHNISLIFVSISKSCFNHHNLILFFFVYVSTFKQIIQTPKANKTS